MRNKIEVQFDQLELDIQTLDDVLNLKTLIDDPAENVIFTAALIDLIHIRLAKIKNKVTKLHKYVRNNHLVSEEKPENDL